MHKHNPKPILKKNAEIKKMKSFKTLKKLKKASKMKMKAKMTNRKLLTGTSQHYYQSKAIQKKKKRKLRKLL